jgi:hypothetical protein
MPDIASTSGRLHSEFVRLLFLQTHRETDRFFEPSGIQFVEYTSGLFHFLLTSFAQQMDCEGGRECVFVCRECIIVKVSTLRITLNLDGVSIIFKSHTRPSHSQTSRLLTSSLSLGVEVPRPTQCMRDT